jgi:biopolymer transport protein TolR
MAVGGSKGGPMASINVTPMADIMIVLLIIFMVATPLMNEPRGLTLPGSRTAAEQREGSVVLVKASGIIEMSGESFASPAELTIRLEARLEGTMGAGRLVQVKADRGLAYGQVLAVLGACRAAGADRIVLMATRPDSLEISP